MDQNPLRPAAEALIEAAALSMKADVIVASYHAMVESLLHPHNTDAVQTVRSMVAIADMAVADHPGTSIGGAGAVFVNDARAVLDSLGVTPADRASVRATIDRTSEQLISSAEEALGEHLLRNMDESAQSGRAN